MRTQDLYLLLGLSFAVFLLYAVNTAVLPRREAFGTSPGTMVQLSTSHVPTAEDAYFYANVYPRMVRREITEMTEDDPGELRPWIFPWYGRGVTLIA
jgi:hypothetical protein